MPPGKAQNTGAVGSSTGGAARSPSTIEADRAAAAASCGAAARTDSRSLSPALMPPSSGSTRCSRTSSPNRRRIERADARVVVLGERLAGQGRLGGDALGGLGAQQRRPPEGVGIGGDAEHEPGGQAVEPVAGGDVGDRRRRRHQLAAEAELVAELAALGDAGEEGVGTLVDEPPGERRRAELAAEDAGLVHDDLVAGGAAGQLPRRRQARDPAPDDGIPASGHRRHVTAVRRGGAPARPGR